MIIGVPKEIKDNEYRVAIVPAGVHALVEDGHKVLVQQGAGLGSGILDEEFHRAGADIVEGPERIFERAEMIIKVKEPLANERKMLREGQILYTYLHLAPDNPQTHDLLENKVTGIAYETIDDGRGGLPLLKPMSEVAGRMSVQVGANYLEKPNGGRGVLLGGVPGVLPSLVVILGGGIVGVSAARMALGLGARVMILDISAEKLTWLDNTFHGQVETLMSNSYNVAEMAAQADLVIGGVLIPGASAPKLVTRKMIANMRKGSVIVDVSVDQGGCIETTRATTHSQPTFEVDGVIHYCVANMPGAVPRTSTFALTNVTLHYARAIAAKGVVRALKEDPHLLLGLNTYKGHVTCEGVAVSQKREYVDPRKLLG